MKGLIRIDHVNQVVWNPFLVHFRGLGCPNIHVPINLHGISADDLSSESLCQFDRQLRFSYSSGTDKEDHSGLLPFRHDGHTSGILMNSVADRKGKVTVKRFLKKSRNL
jgi:hypothetical protein